MTCADEEIGTPAYPDGFSASLCRKLSSEIYSVVVALRANASVSSLLSTFTLEMTPMLGVLIKKMAPDTPEAITL